MIDASSTVFAKPISTHAPAGGATIRQKDFARRWLYFYSRPCGRGDNIVDLDSLPVVLISTHAPAGGATNVPSKQEYSLSNFYSRPCGRGDSNFPQVRHEVLRQIAER